MVALVVVLIVAMVDVLFVVRFLYLTLLPFRVFCGMFFETRGVGLTITFARVLVRAQIDGPSQKPTDTKHHAMCSLYSHAHVP